MTNIREHQQQITAHLKELQESIGSDSEGAGAEAPTEPPAPEAEESGRPSIPPETSTGGGQQTRHSGQASVSTLPRRRRS